jgi:hypothetical protein
MERPEAEILALQALSWAAGLDGTLQQFSIHTGIEIVDLRQQAGNPELLAAFLDFILADDALTKAFCEMAALDSKQLHRARHALPGAGLD